MWEESAPSPGPPHLLSCSQVGGHPSLYIKPHAHLLQTSDLLTLRPKGAHTDGMICPPKDGSRDENCLGSRISLRLFWQEILDYGYPESALEGMHGLLKFFFFFVLVSLTFYWWREEQPQEGLKWTSTVLAMAGVPAAQAQGQHASCPSHHSLSSGLLSRFLQQPLNSSSCLKSIALSEWSFWNANLVVPYPA